MKMHDFTEGVKIAWESLSHHVRAAILLGIIMLFKFIYEDDRRKARRRHAEAGMAMVIVYCLGKFATAMGMAQEWSYVIAAAIGTYGIEYIRNKAAETFDKKFNKPPQE